jgi:SAM-dependent methyltransferase
MKALKTKLHLGAFDDPKEGWLNCDITPHIWIAKIPGLAWVLYRAGKMTAERFEEHRQGVFRGLKYMNVCKRLRLADESCSSVFSSHMLEHLFSWDAEALLREVFRVLQPGGIVRTVVPSLQQCVELYDPNDPSKMLQGIFECSRSGAKNRHQWMYTERSLCDLLLKCGYVNVQPCEYRQGRCEDVARIDNRPENSIYVEGEKPR